MKIQCTFPMGKKFQGIFLTRDDFLANFFSGEGVPPVLEHEAKGKADP